jgi:cytochrome c oxidase assembly protein subunit 15
MSDSREHFRFSVGLYRLSWALVGYTLLVIVWGAWVRISGSGDGCGDHWPLCHGQVLPNAVARKTWVEFAHRLSTAFYGIVVLLQLALVFRFVPKRHPARRWSTLVLLFTVTEALLGAFLVKKGLVAQSHQLLRMLIMPLHLINTSLLLFVGVMTAESIVHQRSGAEKVSPQIGRWLGVCTAGLVLLLTSGAIASLGSHLAPSESILDGLAKDLAPASHPAVRLRILHPLFGLLVPVILLISIGRLRSLVTHVLAELWIKRLVMTVCLAMTVGFCGLIFLGPVWLKLTHLTAANCLVIALSGVFFHSLRNDNA